MEHLSYNGDNPGSVQYGNFINYYKFHPVSDRIKLLPKNIWNKCDSFVALDIGCNAGDLTLSLHEYMCENICESCKILGIDVDPILIERAKEQNISNDITFKCVNFMDLNERDTLKQNYLKSLNITKFNVVFCFSVTMWIHLNYGDTGLEEFLHALCNLSDTIIIEPQPWKCYKSAVKRLKLYNKEFAYFKQLNLKNPNNDIEQFILKQQFCKITEIYESKWKRKILIFKKISC